MSRLVIGLGFRNSTGPDAIAEVIEAALASGTVRSGAASASAKRAKARGPARWPASVCIWSMR